MKQAIAGVAPAEVDEVTSMIVWPSICATGLGRFLERCVTAGAEVAIVSHKTLYGHYDPARINLQDAARSWLVQQGIAGGEGAAIAEADVYFELTREAKVARIRDLQFTHFVDDLAAVFDHPAFPTGIAKILFAPGGTEPDMPQSWTVLPTWQSIEVELFGDG